MEKSNRKFVIYTAARILLQSGVTTAVIGFITMNRSCFIVGATMLLLGGVLMIYWAIKQ